MVVVDKFRLILIHIPKTGGSSIEEALESCHSEMLYGINGDDRAMQHYTWAEIKQLAGDEKFDTYTKFSVCRDPYDRFLSEYYYCPEIGYKKKQTIDEFIRAVETIIEERTYYTTPFHDHFMPQHEFIFDANGKLIVDHLFRFEALKKVHEFLLTHYGVHVLKDITHNSIERELRTPLTEAQKELIYEMYEKDFKLLNYSK